MVTGNVVEDADVMLRSHLGISRDDREARSLTEEQVLLVWDQGKKNA